jgi:hypothetical protein
MSTSTFVERFKNKYSTLSTSGIIEVNPERVVLKPSDTQVHSSIIKASANFMLKKSISPQPDQFSAGHGSSISIHSSINDISHVQSSNLPLNSESPKEAKRKMMPPTPIIGKTDASNKIDYKQLNKSYDKKELKEFKPYTIKDYNSIKPKTYYQLGGLGPSNVGSDDWILKKQLKDKRIKYGLNVYYINATKLPLLPVNLKKNLEKEENVRDRALKFASAIPKPPLRNVISPN